MTGFYDRIGETFAPVLAFFHDIFVPIFGVHAWGWGIIGLTIVVRILLLPLAIKQTRSMRAMQKLQPEIRELQKKYKVDRALMRKDPEQYRAKRQKLNQEMMELYRREKANPAASCLPLLAQAPVFVALFATLYRTDALYGQVFYFFTSFTTPPEGGLEVIVRDGGWPGWMLLLAMSGTMFWSQKQMMARTPTQSDNPMAQQQKILLYAMPIFLGVISLNFPLGILLYWVTTNFWQVGQQWIIFRDVKTDDPTPGRESETPGRRSPGASSGQAPSKSKGTPSLDSSKDDSSSKGADTPPVAKGKKRPPPSGEAGRSRSDEQPRKSSGAGTKGPNKDEDDSIAGPTEDGAKPPPGGAPEQRDAPAGDRGTKGESGKRDHLPRRRPE